MSDLYHETSEATGEQRPHYYDETDYLSGEYDSDIDALLSSKGELPTRQEPPAATRGDNPCYYDETDYLSGEYDSDIDALLASKAQPSSRERSPDTTWGDAVGNHDIDAWADTWEPA